MARIFPFRALRYNTAKAGRLDNLATQPYDKISPEMLERYHTLSPYNLSFIIKNADYADAARRLSEWSAAGVLAHDAAPAVYPYSQTYRVPGSDEVRTRRGFIAAGGLEPYSAGVVFRHEQTLSGPKQDRLALLRATRVHFGQLFMLYSDPEGAVDRLLEPVTACAPLEEVRDEYGVEHRVWSLNDPAAIAAVQQAMALRKLIIADGHHRYETALAFRDECRAATQPRLKHAAEAACEKERVPSSLESVPRWDAVMMTFVNMDQPGLTILPTHRLLRQFPGFDRARFIEAVSRFFSAQPMAVEAGRTALASAPAGQAIGVAFAGADRRPEFVLLRLKPEVRLDEVLRNLSPAERTLDVVVLHQLLLRQCLNIGEEAVREEKFLSYVREFEKGWEAVAKGAPACFFLNPVRIGQMRDIALAGGVMPQKSTDFYPKMLSGLTGYRVD